MSSQNRKSFLRSLGMIGAGAILTNGVYLPKKDIPETPTNTEPTPLHLVPHCG